MLEFQVNEVQTRRIERDHFYNYGRIGRVPKWRSQTDISELPGEEWRPIPGFEGLYLVSSLGRFLSIPGRRNCRKARILRSSNSRGYRQVTLSKAGKKTRQSAHTIVCIVFHGPKPSPSHQVAHGDGCRSNNCAKNLRWATGKENQADRRIHGTDLRGERAPLAKLTETKVRAIKKALRNGATVHALTRRYNVVESTIKNIRAGNTWAHIE